MPPIKHHPLPVSSSLASHIWSHLPKFAIPALALLVLAAPVTLQAQAAVSVTAPLNGDRITPGTPFVISASATVIAGYVGVLLVPQTLTVTMDTPPSVALSVSPGNTLITGQPRPICSVPNQPPLLFL
jgi:hypothetical protein